MSFMVYYVFEYLYEIYYIFHKCLNLYSISTFLDIFVIGLRLCKVDHLKCNVPDCLMALAGSYFTVRTRTVRPLLGYL